MSNMQAGEYVYPVAEIFNSIQGEGAYVGTRMTFVRLAGCSVGKPYTQEARKQLDLPIYRVHCEDWAGSGFACDTDFRTKFRGTAQALLKEIGDPRRVCITGGEPLMHDLWPLVRVLKERNIKVHLETSGTISPIPHGIWITVSPKIGFRHEVLALCNEIKILVGDGFNEGEFVARFSQYFNSNKVFVQPISGEHSVDETNLRRCIELTDKYPVRLSCQMHKYWGVR